MKHIQYGFVSTSIGLLLALLAMNAASADNKTMVGAQTLAATATQEATPTPAATEPTQPAAAKPERLRYRSGATSGCTPAAGGLSEADILKAQQARSKIPSSTGSGSSGGKPLPPNPCGG